MNINIFGMGYVGAVTAACLANYGYNVIGIDIDEKKIKMINNGKSPIVEPGLEDAIKKGVDSKRLKTAKNHFQPAEISFVCVGTPSNENGSLRLDHVVRVSEKIGDYLRELSSYHVVNIRSTVLPGTVEQTVIPIIEDRSGKKAGLDFGVCMNPEFMREGTSIHDFHNPTFTLIGELDTKSGDYVVELYKDIRAPLIRTSIKVAEMIKYACNIFHALKISFANEIGNICKSLNMDSHEVMDIFCHDKKLNISPYYLKPGFAFGGSCLPKDMRALLYKTKELDLDTPVLSSIMRSNQNQIELASSLIRRNGKKNIGILGISFKDNTDDLRESPMVELVERLIGKGYNISIFDKEVSLAKLFGSNKEYIEKTIPHISLLLKESVQEVIENSDVIVVGKKSKEFEDIVSKMNKNKIVVDLVRIAKKLEVNDEFYEGICW